MIRRRLMEKTKDPERDVKMEGAMETVRSEPLGMPLRRCTTKTKADEIQGGEQKKARNAEKTDDMEEAMMLDKEQANEAEEPRQQEVEDDEEELPQQLVDAGMREEFASLARLQVYDAVKLDEVPEGAKATPTKWVLVHSAGQGACETGPAGLQGWHPRK